LLHVTTRYLDRQGQVEQGKDYHAFPAEEWIPLTSADEAELVPQADAPSGSTWTVDLAYSGRLLSRFYPLTGNMSEPEKNPLREAGLSARVLAGRRDIAWIRLDGRVSLEHSFFRDKDSRPVDAVLTGYIEYDRAARRIRSFRLITEHAVYGRENFAVAVRSVP
jgi:hypothetical protein